MKADVPAIIISVIQMLIPTRGSLPHTPGDRLSPLAGHSVNPGFKASFETTSGEPSAQSDANLGKMPALPGQAFGPLPIVG
jgi:hypothetical protein